MSVAKIAHVKHSTSPMSHEDSDVRSARGGLRRRINECMALDDERSDNCASFPAFRLSLAAIDEFLVRFIKVLRPLRQSWLVWST